MLPDLLLQSLQTLASAVPPSGRRHLARALGSLQYRLSPVRRAGVLHNLSAIAAAHPPLLAEAVDRERAARRVFESYQLTWMEYLGRGRKGASEALGGFRLRNADLLYRATSGGRGVVVAAPHVGSWDLAGLALARLGFRVRVVTGVQLHPGLAAAVRAMKERDQIQVSTPEDGFTPLLTSLRAGELVILLVDGDVYSRAIEAPFLGRRVAFPSGPAILCRRAGAPLLHAHAERERHGGHRISFDALDGPDFSLPVRADLERLTARVASILEETVAANASQWCVFRPLDAAGAA
jgi:KDO2-lipid IV(A) lauroyltransferase